MEWKEVGGIPYSNIIGMDPLAPWLLDSGRVHFNRGDDKTLIPFIIAFFKDDDFTTFVKEVNSQSAGDDVRLLVTEFYDGFRPGKYFVAHAGLGFFQSLTNPELSDPTLLKIRDAPKQIKLGLPLKPSSLPDKWVATPKTPPLSATPDDTVIIGVIDDGIAFAHERFRGADGTTRVHYFWRMDGPMEIDSTVSTGREIWKADLGARRGIDHLLQDATIGGLVDEEKVYREAGFVDFRQEDHKAAAWNSAHGTHVLDLAAGYRPADAPPNVAIIAVQLPVAATADTSGAGLEVHVAQAVDYILKRANHLANGRPEFPVVINFSYGTFAGPHDTTSAIEVLLDQAIASSINVRGAPLSVALPSGNGHLSRCHAQMVFSGRKHSYCLNWRVQPDDLTSTQMEIWMPYDGCPTHQNSRVKIRIETPSGLLSPPLGEVHGHALRLIENNQVLLEASYASVPLPTERGLFCISMVPTAILEPVDPARVPYPAVAPAGIWKVHVLNASLKEDEPVEAWIQRDDAIYGYPRRGRQSYFEARCYRRFHPITGDVVKWDYEENDENAKERLTVRPCHVKRRSMLNSIGTGSETIVVGGVFGKELQVVEYSAGGPVTPAPGTSLPSRAGPDALAVSDDSKIHRGVIAAGSRSGSAARMNGTSVAAPQVARIIGELWAGRTHDGSRPALRVEAAAEEAANPHRPSLPPEIRGGRGRFLVERPDRPRRVDP